MANSISADVRQYINDSRGHFTKRVVAEEIWPKWRAAGLRATENFKSFKTYVGAVILSFVDDGLLEEVGEPCCFTGSKSYRRVKVAAKASSNLASVPTSELVAELNRRFG